MYVQKVAGASPDRWDHGAPTGQRRTPLVKGIMCLYTLPLQDQPPEHKWTFTFLNDEPDLPEHEVQEPEDTHKKGKPCLILFNTRSVQDTFHDACVCLTHHVNFSGDRVRGARFCRHLHRALSSDRVRGACTCRHPCSASSSNRIRGTCTCCHLRSAFFSDRVRGVRTCCLPCRTRDTD